MPVKIPSNHPIFELKTKVQAVSQQFLTTFGFNYFQYLRCFADGSMGLLTNNTGLIEHFQHIDHSPVVFSSFERENEKAHAYWFLWDEKLPASPVQLAREKCNLRNGLTLVRRSKNYYDMIAVALPTEHPNPGSFYMNKLTAIEQFINEFDVDNKDLIALMNRNAIALPDAYRDINYQNICLSSGRINFISNQGETYITSQELACLRLLFQGASFKKIAQTLGVSSRTVETYLLRAKRRTGVSSYAKMQRMMAAYSI